MKKNKIFYLVILFLVTLFSFNLDVYADLKEDARNNTCEALKNAGELDGENLLIDNASSYEANCIYTLTVEKQCVILQAVFNKNGSFKVEGIPYYEFDGFWEQMVKQSAVFTVQGDNWHKDVDEKYFKDRIGSCPRVNYSVAEKTLSGETIATTIYQERFGFGGSEGTTMTKFFERGVEFEVPSVIVSPNNDKKTSCKEILGESGVKLLKTIKNLFMILVPIALIVLATIDMSSAVFAGDENNMKKAQGKLIKRIIIAVVIFLVPIVLQFFLKIGNEIWPDAIDATLCGIYE